MSPSDPPLTPQRWLEVREAFEQVIELDAADRAVGLEERCGDDRDLRRRVEQMLLALDHESTLLERPAIRLGSADAESEIALGTGGFEPRPPGAGQIGPYRLVRQLGRGGMGEVFLAERADEAFHKEVAIKLLRRGGDSEELARRFRRERQILAGLEHPNIAQLLDGGTTEDGTPYLVMEYVRGEPIDRYCRRAGLGLRERIALFLQICDGVQFAHQSLVVHRDLKPGNILVTAEGEPKLLDFGIAKLLQPEAFPQTVLPTRTGLAPMTPAYASPEQIRGQPVTTATDVYALGVLLYELLTGRRPYEVETGNLDTLVDAICHRQPPKPSTAVRDWARSLRVEMGAVGRSESAERSAAAADETGWASSPESDGGAPSTSWASLDPARLGRQLAGDLDAIVLRALAKEPGERYASAARLRDDLGRHLDGHPVHARRGTFFYQAEKFVRRHRWAVAGLVGAFLALSTFVLVLLYQQRQLLAENERTRVQRARAETVSDWMTELFELPAPSRSRGETITARELLDKGAREIDQGLGDDPELRAELMGTIGQTYAKLGLLDEGIELLERSVELHRRQGQDEPAMLARRLQQLSDSLTVRGEYRRALPLAEQALELRAAQINWLAEHGPARDVSAEDVLAEDVLAGGASAEDDREEPVPSRRESVLHPAVDEARAKDEDEGAAGLDPRTVEALAALADSQARLGHLHDLLGEYARARTLLDRARNLARRLGRKDTLAKALEYGAEVRLGMGEPEAARVAYAESLELWQEIHGDRHPEIALLRASMALASRASDYAAAEALLRSAIEEQRRLFEGPHPVVATALNNLGLLLYERLRHGEAHDLLVEALDMQRELFGNDHPKVWASQVNLALVEGALGRLEAAEARCRRACDGLEGVLGPEHPETGQCRSNLAELLLRGRRAEEALPLLEQAEATLEARLGPDHPRLAGVLNIRGQVDRLRGNLDGARRALERSVAIARARGGLPVLLSATFNLGVVLGELEQPGPAAARFEEALEILHQRASQPRLELQIETRLAPLLLELGQHGRAQEVARRAYEGWLEAAGPSSAWTLSAQATFGRALLRGGQVAEAETLLLGLLAELRATRPPTSRRLRRAYEHVIELWQTVGDRERAANYAKILEALPTEDEP